MNRTLTLAQPCPASIVLFLGAFLLTSCGGSGSDETTPATVIVEWNQRLFAAAEAEDGFLTLKGLRSVTMFHLAVQDALASIDASGEFKFASPIAAAAGAGYLIASTEYPDLAAEWLMLRDRSVAELHDSSAQALGTELGRASAEALRAQREGDGWSSEASYDWHPMAPGVYAEFNEHSGTPEGFIFGAGWAQVTPFALDSPSQFVSPSPPDISSPEYAAAFEEVKEVGSFKSDQRTADQTHFAMWWKEFVESSHNRLARELIAETSLSLREANLFLVLLNVSVHDAYVSSFYNKFRYNHWRPYTAIRWADHDGNPATVGDEHWDNLHHHTYAFPSYPSAHGTACAAAMTVFADTFGETFPFKMTIPKVESAGPLSEKIAMDPASRSFTSFDVAAKECALSRLYLGIHFRYDSVAGTALGRQVGQQVIKRLKG